MLTKKNILIALLSITVISPVMAKVYKWTDDSGKTHYTSTPPPTTIKAKESKEVKIHKIPKSSLTFKPKYRAPVETTYKKKIKKVAKKKRSKIAKNEECTNTSLAERKAMMRDGEKNAKKAVAEGRMTEESYKRTREMFRRAIIDCE